MVTMIDEIFDRHYQGARKEMNDVILSGVASLGHAVAEAFRVLNRIEYQAPWATPAKGARGN